MTTIKDIAAQAQVSATTVSHALNPQKRHLVAPETVQKVKAIAQQLNYQPAAMPNSKAPLSTLHIGLIKTLTIKEEAEDTYWRFIKQGIYETARQERIQITQELSIQDNIDPNSLRSLDGLIVLGSFGETAIKTLQTVNNNVVVVDAAGHYYNFVDTIGTNLYDLTYSILQQLWQKKHQPIAFIGGRRAEYNLDGTIAATGVDRRLKAYQDFITEHEQPEIISLSHWDSAGGKAAIQKLWQSSASFGSVVCASDPIAIGVVNFLNQQKITLGNDLALVSFDDLDVISYLTPSLTSVWLPKAELGQNAVLQLQARAHWPRSWTSNISILGEIHYRTTFQN